MAGLAEVTRNVLVATHAFCTSTTTVVTGNAGRAAQPAARPGDGPWRSCLVVDPGITPAELDELAADLSGRRLRVAAGFATHPHWDHVLWSRALGGDVPRFATAASAAAAAAGRDDGLAEARTDAPGTDGQLFARLTPVPGGGTGLPWRGRRVEVVEHRAHAPGHAALLADGVLIAGDMCSDVEVPLLDLDAADPLGDYHHALDLFESLAHDVRHVVPGHGHVGDHAELRRRLDADRRYLDELAAGRGDDDPRLTTGWLVRDHHAQRTAVMPRPDREGAHPTGGH
ncbi:MBL fold metallo-hydrolase [Jiangella endophytica]|uniref:MBL fold metallo-hydrolase n=1 Tax=Jiangella endophytica TaxID=1623398 RepID=UPI0013007742|nr:MBL fold metallo-hydrolase [Jiangella endophytica]